MTPGSILIIDDDEQIRGALRLVLEKAGYRVMEASNGRAGLRRFRQTPAALVITDLLMPNEDGLDVTIALHCEAPHVKIIVLMGGSEERDYLDAAKFLGAHRTIRKPVTAAEVLEAVQQELQGGSPTKEMGHKERGDRRRKTRLRCGSLLIGASLAPSVLAADFLGPVVSILDGDTIEVLHNQRPERIRLSGIDCPEKGQACGKRAKQAASESGESSDTPLAPLNGTPASPPADTNRESNLGPVHVAFNRYGRLGGCFFIS